MVTVEQLAHDELQQLLSVLPPRVLAGLQGQDDLDDLLEIVLDLGRPPEARFSSGDVMLDEEPVGREDLQHVVSGVGDFGGDNRAGMERTLHRISAIRNRNGSVVGITCRVGRAVFGTIKIIEDLAYGGKNILLLGRPGVGKTTMLREVARVLADEARKRVIIVDTSNEIAGDGDIPHPAIGHARRMQVPAPTEQHGVMIEAVENHMPQVIIIDEMGTTQEAAAARTIAERGVQLVATAHGNTLDNLIMNPTLSDLIGGVQTVTLGDQEARFRGTQKTVLERKAPPTFDVVVEIQDWNEVAVHDDVAQVVDQWLRGYPVEPEIRHMNEDGNITRTAATRQNEAAPTPWAANEIRNRRGRNRNGRGQDTYEQYPPERFQDEADASGSAGPRLEARIFLFGVSRDKVEAALAERGATAEIVSELRRANVLLTTKNHYRRGSQLVRVAENNSVPVYVLRKNTVPQVGEFLTSMARDQGIELPPPSGRHKEEANAEAEAAARAEAEEAARRVLSGEFSVQLEPQRPYIRRLQHMLAEEFNLASASRGRDPQRGVLIYRP
ncbi:MAG: AAA family ATPase [Chloroflexota bacterium]|nr:AAA family ATPase [Chloroflexota bacterium]